MAFVSMEVYDVIIVGGGPAGLKCAEVLGHAGKHVLLLEKNNCFGQKLCAGGLTMKDMEILPLPGEFIEHRITKASIHSKLQKAETIISDPFLFTINRKELGIYQAGLLKDLSVDMKMNSHVKEIRQNKVILKDGREYEFKFLVGAEGYSSVVRKHLKLEVKKRLIGFQYTIPMPEVDPVLEIFLDPGNFYTWYAWIFPHRNSIAVGCCCDPKRVNHRKIIRNFQKWLIRKNIDVGDAKLESCPISYDFKGLQFGNIFLTGEAAGLASGFTGEGIYQALVSGQEAAKMILDTQYTSHALDQMHKYNRVLHRVMLLFRIFGPFRGLLFEFFLFLMNRKWFRNRINARFL
jgi:geranylgeranyl reductase family protein